MTRGRSQTSQPTLSFLPPLSLEQNKSPNESGHFPCICLALTGLHCPSLHRMIYRVAEGLHALFAYSLILPERAAVHRAPTEKGSVEPSARRVAERTHGVRSDTVTKPNFQKGRRRELAVLLSPLVAPRSNSNCDRSAHRISVLTLTLIPAAWLVLWENASPNANSPRQRCEPCKESIR